MGDNKSIAVEAIGTFRLLLKTGFYLDLEEKLMLPLFRQNLVSIFVLDKSSYSCSFGNNKFSFFQNSNLIGTGSLYIICWIQSLHIMKFCILVLAVQNEN